jgi:hypothetical protein
LVRAPAHRLHLRPGRQSGAVATGRPARRGCRPRRLEGEGEKVRRYGEFHYAAKSWNVERRVIARVEAGPQGADSRFIVTNLPGLPKSLYEKIYCARGQVENLIKAHKLHLASDRTSCSKATANQFRLLIHTAAYWLMLTLRELAGRLRHARRPNRQAAAVTDGAVATYAAGISALSVRNFEPVAKMFTVPVLRDGRTGIPEYPPFGPNHDKLDRDQ